MEAEQGRDRLDKVCGSYHFLGWSEDEDQSLMLLQIFRM